MKANKFDKLILFLSIYTVAELWISIVVNYSNQVQNYASYIDTAICCIFLYDFFSRLFTSADKLTFIKSNWIDFASSIPFVAYLRIGRVARIIRIFRVLRSGKVFYKTIDENKSISIFQSVLIFNIILVILSALSVYSVEHEINPQFSSIMDSMWWAFITMTTVGYGDIVPITPEGKFFSVILIGMGILLIGTFTAMVTDYFVKDKIMLKKLESIENKLDKLLKKDK